MEWKDNIQKTKENYEALLDQFITSELIQTNPLVLSEQELVDMLERRARNSGGISWFENTGHFFSECKLDRIIPHNIGGAHPWTQICFEPIRNVGTVTPGRFTYASPVVFPHSGIVDRGQYKANVIHGCQEDYLKLGYFQNHLGLSYVLCYRFPTWNSFNIGSNYDCIRLAVMDYKREALILTQGYVINYLLNHPLDCFPGLVMDGFKARRIDKEKQEELYSPIMESRYNELIDIKARFEQYLSEYNLEPELL